MHQQRHQVTIDSLSINWMKIEISRVKSAVSATMGKARLLGLLRDRNQTFIP